MLCMYMCMLMPKCECVCVYMCTCIHVCGVCVREFMVNNLVNVFDKLICRCNFHFPSMVEEWDSGGDSSIE